MCWSATQHNTVAAMGVKHCLVHVGSYHTTTRGEGTRSSRKHYDHGGVNMGCGNFCCAMYAVTQGCALTMSHNHGMKNRCWSYKRSTCNKGLFMRDTESKWLWTKFVSIYRHMPME